ncbi:hypothetical protein FB451DRAFT_1270640 [Mycena latifolia]|nr:hypothetical protein FB451DRAFT_1270640 [Mycena latifolia]
MEPECCQCGASPRTTRPVLVSLAPSRLLASNDIPLSSEIPTIQRMIFEGNERIALLNAELAEMQEAMERRARERDEAVEYVRHHTAVVSAVRRLPAELICEIFGLTLPFTQQAGECSWVRPPWELAHVNQCWRAVALGFPALWSSIMIHKCPSLSIEATCPKAMVEMQLLWSRNAPLDIAVEWHGGGDLNDSKAMEVIDLILRQSVRWERMLVCLRSTPPGPFIDRLHIIKGRLPLLRRLEFTCTTGMRANHPPSAPVPSDAFSIAPNLREVYFITAKQYRTYQERSLPFSFAIPWAQITRFRGFYGIQQDPLATLNAAPNILECGMAIASTDELPTIAIVTLPRLRRLHLAGAGHVLNFMTVPMLQDLYIAGDSLDALLRCMQLSSCQLAKLVVYDCYAPDTLIPILAALPTLTTFFVELSLPSGVEDGTLWDALRLTGGPSALCPNLSHIAAGGYAWFDLESFVDMIESRRWDTTGPSPLSFVRAFCTKKRPARLRDRFLARVQRLKDAGLDFDCDPHFDFTTLT